MNKLPIFELIFDGEAEGLTKIALVDDPAIGQKGYTFNAEKPSDTNNSYKFEVIDEEEGLILAPAMIPDLPIYRVDERGEYFVVFSKSTIKGLVEKFASEKKTDQFNIMHKGDVVPGINVVQSFITSEKMGIKAPAQFENINEGAWFIVAKVSDKETFAKVKENGLIGFSIEGIFKEVPFEFKKNEDGTFAIVEATQATDDTMQEGSKIAEILERFEKKIISIFKKPEPAMTEAKLAKKYDLGEATLEDGSLVKWNGEELTIGIQLVAVNTNGDELSLPDGSYEFEDGRIVTTKGGLVDEIMDAPEVESKFMDDMTGKVQGLIEELKKELGDRFEIYINGYFEKHQINEKLDKAAELVEKHEEMVAQMNEKFNKAVESFQSVSDEIIKAIDANDAPTDSNPLDEKKSPEQKLFEKSSRWKKMLDEAMPKNTLNNINKNNTIEK